MTKVSAAERHFHAGSGLGGNSLDLFQLRTFDSKKSSHLDDLIRTHESFGFEQNLSMPGSNSRQPFVWVS